MADHRKPLLAPHFQTLTHDQLGSTKVVKSDATAHRMLAKENSIL